MTRKNDCEAAGEIHRRVLDRVFRRAFTEDAAGAPAEMIVFYVAVEVRHALLHDDGTDAQSCGACVEALATQRDEVKAGLHRDECAA